MGRELARLFKQVDVLVTPTLPILRNTEPFNLTGLPALALPCGFSPDRLPVSMQVIGRPFDEVTVLRVGHAYERATAWHRQRPSV